MSEQSRLLQQVEEIRQRAKVCPDCGAMRAEHPDHRILCANHECQGGQVTAPDTDALCSALVTLAQAVEAREEASKAGCAFAEKHRQYRRDGQPPAMEAELDELCANSEETRKRVVETHAAALALLRDGMQHGEP